MECIDRQKYGEYTEMPHEHREVKKRKQWRGQTHRRNIDLIQSVKRVALDPATPSDPRQRMAPPALAGGVTDGDVRSSRWLGRVFIQNDCPVRLESPIRRAYRRHNLL